jgi:hypothetical protein
MATLATVIRERAPLLLLCGLALSLPACESDGHFTLFGYSTVPNYDPNIRTVYVPIFQNKSFRRGLEFELTQAVIQQIEQKTPFKVVHSCDCADTELIGTIVGYTKGILNRNQQNEVREAQTLLTVEVLWRDRRTGEILSGPARRLTDAPPAMAVPVMTAQPIAQVGGPGGASDGHSPVPPGPPPPPPVLVTSLATFIPEVGESITTAELKNVQRLATQIVSMMEVPW